MPFGAVRTQCACIQVGRKEGRKEGTRNQTTVQIMFSSVRTPAQEHGARFNEKKHMLEFLLEKTVGFGIRFPTVRFPTRMSSIHMLQNQKRNLKLISSKTPVKIISIASFESGPRRSAPFRSPCSLARPPARWRR